MERIGTSFYNIYQRLQPSFRAMFGNHLFKTWPVVVLSACCFSGLFALVLYMSETFFFGWEESPPTVLGIAILSFVGYLGVAALIRAEHPDH